MEEITIDGALNDLLKRSKKDAEASVTPCRLGTYVGSKIDIDGLGPRPLSSFVFLQQFVNPYSGEGGTSEREWEDAEYKNGDRVLLVPVGTSYAVVGKVI